MRVHPREPKRATGTDTRRRILAVALELFSTRGYAGTSIRDIAEAMAMTKAALYYHFESKEQILEAVTEPIRAEMELVLQAATGPAPPGAEELLTRLVDMLSRHGLLIRTIFNDPSSVRPGQHEAPMEMFRAVSAVLAGDRGRDGLLRAFCAIGAVQFGVLGTVRTDARFGEPLRAGQALRMLDGREHILDAAGRAEVVAAAMRALSAP